MISHSLRQMATVRGSGNRFRLPNLFLTAGFLPEYVSGVKKGLQAGS